MGFWGMSNAGKEAEGWPREYGAWGQGQFKSWIPRSDKATAGGEAATDWARAWAENRANQGFGPINQMIEYGRQIMPGVDQYVSNRQGRVQDMMDRFGQLPQWQDTMARIDAANAANRNVNNTNLGYIDSTRNYALNDIGDTYARGVGYEGDASGRITGDLTDRYNDLRGQNRDVYGGLKGSAEDTYGDALKDVDLLRPGSEFSVAQTARSFAPMMASTAGKLRRMGVDTASPQGLSAMQRVETARSRAMDDAAAAGTDKYVNARTNLLAQRQGARERLGTGELEGEIGLSGAQGAGLRGEYGRHAGALTDLDRARSGAAINTQNLAMDRITQNQGREMQINDQDARNAQLQKAMATGDWDTYNQLLNQMSASELEAIGLHQGEFGAGTGYRSMDLNERNQGAQQVGQYGQGLLDYGLRSSQAAQGWGNTAEGAYGTAYGYEAPNAGWGLKMLTGAAGAGLNMLAPGAGSVMTSGGSGGWGQLGNTVKGWFGGPSAGNGYGAGGPQMASLPSINRNNPWAFQSFG